MRQARARAPRLRAGALVLGCLLLPAGVVLTAVTATATAAASTSANPSLGTVVVSSPGPGYTITSEGPLHPSEFGADSPDATAAAAVLARLAQTASTYVRTWENGGGANRVQDLLVRFPSVEGAQSFLRAARGAFQSGEIVSTGSLAAVPGARRTVYLASVAQAGVGQVVTMRVGTDVDVLSFFSQASGHAPPISPADTLRVARAQQSAIVSVPGATVAAPAGAAKKGGSIATAGWAALAVAVLAAAVAAPLILRRHGAGTPASGRALRSGHSVLGEE